MNFTSSELSTVRRSQEPNRRQFLGGSDARTITGGDEAVLIRSRPEQNVQTKSQRCLVLLREDTRPTNARAAKSSTTQAPSLRPGGRKSSRTRHGQQHTGANLASFMPLIRRFMKAYAILRQKLYARFSEHTFDQGNRVLVSRVATDLDIRDRVSMQTSRPSQVPNRPIERSTRHPNLCTCHNHETVPLSHVTVSHSCLPCGQINGESGELRIV